MLKAVVKKILGSRHIREAKKLRPEVNRINALFEEYQSLPEEQFKGKTDEFRARIVDATAEIKAEMETLREEKRHSEDPIKRQDLQEELADLDERLVKKTSEVLEELLPEAFATIKETCRRLMGSEVTVTGQKQVWDMVPYDVQLIGAIALHRGKVAEMATGEGKTLVATMPLYLNALVGEGVHLVTVNTYLAQRDAEWMGYIYNYLGLTVDCIDKYEPHSPDRTAAYAADITYGTNNEFGFDYLRDNMVHALDQRVQRRHWYAIIDEVDSILIDEARTPLIISGPVGRDTSTPFKQYNPLVGNLYRKQTRVVSELIAEAEKELEVGNEFEAGERLLAAKRGGPRNKRLLKLFADDPGLQKLVLKVEGDYMREKRLYEIDELLLFAMDEKGHNVHLSDAGLDELAPGDSEAFVVPDLSEAIGAIEEEESISVDAKREMMSRLEAEYASKSEKIHVIHQLLKAYTLFQRDEKYIIGEAGEIVIVDEFTGRQMAGRRWSDGLHQAVEAKEGVEIKGETQTLATITIQNYFRMYDKLAGMTGTAETEETEFHQIYKLDVFVIPTNQPVVRDDSDDLIFRTKREKYQALMDEIERLHRMELPVLVGTTNVEISETQSRMLKRRGIEHNVLNAKQHKQESEIVAEAGRAGAVTIATNMAGRGTDIKLGEGVTEPRTVEWAKSRGLSLGDLVPVDPTKEIDLEGKPDNFVIEVGGLHILGSERHESRRIDRQLRGRCGRQGDPGASQFFISVEDDLMRLFVGDRLANAMDKLGASEGEVITHPLVTRSIETAQKRVEGNNFEARKRLLDYDDVMNQQREVIYDRRLFALEGGEDLKGEMWEMIEHTVQTTVDEYLDFDRDDDWDLAGLKRRLTLDYFTVLSGLPDENDPEHELEIHEIQQMAVEAVHDQFRQKIEGFGEHSEGVTGYIMLSVIDGKWKDHLYDLDHLKASIGFRGWGQKDPLVEYKKEAYEMFVDLMNDLRGTVANLLFKAQIGQSRQPVRQAQRLQYSGPSEVDESGGAIAHAAAVQRSSRTVGGAAGRVDQIGVSETARSDSGRRMVSLGSVGGVPSPQDPRQLVTNRGEERVRAPITATKEPGRNEPCPCGSGKKYKKCHGRRG
ncbi:MAG: preprotein translocase subunit SecA [Gemmatimonadota bacterium]|nr:preprotein translocase subunit SecA [Gemmatimonadota bacterium]